MRGGRTNNQDEKGMGNEGKKSWKQVKLGVYFGVDMVIHMACNSSACIANI